MKISVSKSAHSRYWKQVDIDYKNLVSLLSHYTITDETMQEYDELSHDEQAEKKNVGGFVGGELLQGRRKKGNVLSRCLICLDADFADNSFVDKVHEVLGSLSYIIYSTRSDRPSGHRYRLILPLKRPCKPDEYEPICRYIAGAVGIDYFDGTTFQAERLMYFGSVSKDQEFFFYSNDGLFLDGDTVLTTYDDWSNPDNWVYGKGEDKKTVAYSGNTQENPQKKSGVIGAFCRLYSVSNAIDTFLQDVYKPFDDAHTRYTYINGTSSGGLVLYDDLFCYGYQNTDPASGRLCNAWDIVRIHKFGNSTRSETQMCEFALSLNEVRKQMGLDKQKEVKEVFGDMSIEDDITWEENLKRDKKGAVLVTVPNMKLIFSHDINLKDTIRYDEFAEKMMIVKPLAWRKNYNTYASWQDADWSSLYNYLAVRYGFTGRSYKEVAKDVFNELQYERRYHPVKEYLELCEKMWDGTKRADTLFADFLGAENSRYNRMVCHKMLLGAVRRIYRPACQFDTMCVLVGAQGGGKTSFLQRLGKGWFTNSIKDLSNKDALQQLGGNWIIELGELSAMKRSDIDSVKNFITRTTDSFRPAFGKEVKDRPRQCVLFGTCNDTNFLSDMSGNRRFWIVDCEQDRNKARQLGYRVADKLTPEFVDQIWGEVMSWGMNEPLYLPEDIIEKAQEQEEKYSAASEMLDVIRNYLDTPVPDAWSSWSLEQRVDWWKRRNDPNSLEVKGTHLRKYISAIEIYQELIQSCNLKELAGGARGVKTIMRGLRDWTYTGKMVLTSPSYGKQRCFERVNVDADEER